MFPLGGCHGIDLGAVLNDTRQWIVRPFRIIVIRDLIQRRITRYVAQMTAHRLRRCDDPYLASDRGRRQSKIACIAHGELPRHSLHEGLANLTCDHDESYSSSTAYPHCLRGIMSRRISQRYESDDDQVIDQRDEMIFELGKIARGFLEK
jgi:hypothetical protein